MSFMALPFYLSSDQSSESPSTSSKEETIKQPYHLLPRNQCPSKCAVCRNPSIGYHYNVPSCSGCKTFFRRTIVNGRRFICTLSRNCLDVVEDERMCRACRFKRCVEVGMDPTAIRVAVKSPEGTFLLNEVVKKQLKMNQIGTKMETSEDVLSKMIRKLTLLEEKAEHLHREAIPLEYDDFRNLDQILREVPVFDSRQIKDLTPAKRVKSKHNCQSYIHSGLLATIEQSKTFDYSSKLDFRAKTTLVKHIALIGSIMLGSSFSMFIKNSDVLLSPDGNCTADHTDCITNNMWYQYRLQLQKTLHAFLSNKIDRVEYVLLKAILMCNPAVTDLTSDDQMILGEERNRYAKFLLDYCILQHGIMNGPGRFGSLLSINTIVELQSKNQKDFYILMKATSQDKGCSNPPRVMFDEVMDP